MNELGETKINNSKQDVLSYLTKLKVNYSELEESSRNNGFYLEANAFYYYQTALQIAIYALNDQMKV